MPPPGGSHVAIIVDGGGPRQRVRRLPVPCSYGQFRVNVRAALDRSRFTMWYVKEDRGVILNEASMDDFLRSDVREVHVNLGELPGACLRVLR